LLLSNYGDFRRKNFRAELAGTVTEISAPLVTAGCVTGDHEIASAKFALSCN